MREIWGTQRGVSDVGMEVMGGDGIERGRSLLGTTTICMKFRQCGQGSARSEEAKVFTAVKLERSQEGSFQALTAESPQTPSGAADSKQSRFRSCTSLSVHPSIPPSHPPRAALEPAEPRVRHQEETIKQSRAAQSDTCQSCAEEALTTYLCTCVNSLKPPVSFLNVFFSFSLLVGAL